WLRRAIQLVSLAGQELPVSALFLPDLKSADPDAVGLAVGFAVGFIDVACDRGVAGNRDFEVGEVDRLHRRLPGHHAVDELGLVLDPAVRMAITYLIGGHAFQLGFIRIQEGFSQRLDLLLHRRLVTSYAKRRRSEQQARHAERERTVDRQVATGYMHKFLPQVWINS